MSELFAGAIKFTRPISYTGKSSIGENTFLYTKDEMDLFTNDLKTLKSSIKSTVLFCQPIYEKKAIRILEGRK